MCPDVSFLVRFALCTRHCDASSWVMCICSEMQMKERRKPVMLPMVHAKYLNRQFGAYFRRLQAYSDSNYQLSLEHRLSEHIFYAMHGLWVNIFHDKDTSNTSICENSAPRKAAFKKASRILKRCHTQSIFSVQHIFVVKKNPLWQRLNVEIFNIACRFCSAFGCWKPSIDNFLLEKGKCEGWFSIFVIWCM